MDGSRWSLECMRKADPRCSLAYSSGVHVCTYVLCICTVRPCDCVSSAPSGMSCILLVAVDCSLERTTDWTGESFDILASIFDNTLVPASQCV